MVMETLKETDLNVLKNHVDLVFSLLNILTEFIVVSVG